MSSTRPRPILVTGSHRSGSTWVGRMIAQSPSVGYIHEPFHLFYRPGFCGARFDFWYTHISAENEDIYRRYIDRCLSFEYNLGKALMHLRGIRDVVRMTREFSHFTLYRMLDKRPLMKDPIALLSAEWLAKTFDMEVVVLIRHPAAFVGSLVKAEWPHPFDHFLQQPQLMRGLLSDFHDEIQRSAEIDSELIDQAILLWNILHKVIYEYQKRNPNWIFVKHEDISRDPIPQFARIFDSINLPFSHSVRKRIASHSLLNSSNKTREAALRRDSKSNILSWKTRLTDEEIAKVRAETHQVWRHFYGEDDWA